MQLISCHRGLLRVLSGKDLKEAAAKRFYTGLAGLDALPPGGSFTCGAVHEILTRPEQGLARFFAFLLARCAAMEGLVVWCDPRHEIYPPALAAGGLPLDRLVLLRPRSPAEEVWAAAECLRCKGVGVTVAAPPRLSRVEARRLQLAAEHGGGVGLLLRPFGPASDHYAASTRWLVEAAAGGAEAQQWNVQLIHGHGGRVGQSVVLEASRETNTVCVSEALADRPGETKKARTSA